MQLYDVLIQYKSHTKLSACSLVDYSVPLFGTCHDWMLVMMLSVTIFLLLSNDLLKLSTSALDTLYHVLKTSTSLTYYPSHKNNCQKV